MEDTCTADVYAWQYALALIGARIGEDAVLETSPEIRVRLRNYVGEMARLLDAPPALPK